MRSLLARLAMQAIPRSSAYSLELILRSPRHYGRSASSILEFPKVAVCLRLSKRVQSQSRSRTHSQRTPSSLKWFVPTSTPDIGPNVAIMHYCNCRRMQCLRHAANCTMHSTSVHVMTVLVSAWHHAPPTRVLQGHSGGGRQHLQNNHLLVRRSCSTATHGTASGSVECWKTWTAWPETLRLRTQTMATQTRYHRC